MFSFAVPSGAHRLFQGCGLQVCLWLGGRVQSQQHIAFPLTSASAPFWGLVFLVLFGFFFVKELLTDLNLLTWLECINLHVGSKICYGIAYLLGIPQEERNQCMHVEVKLLQNITFCRDMGVSRMSCSILMAGPRAKTNAGTVQLFKQHFKIQGNSMLFCDSKQNFSAD